MPGKVDLYDGEYGNFASDVYRQVRVETYGVDFGQTSWVTTEESAHIPAWLGLTSDSRVLEIGCGSGLYALHLAQTIRCNVTGLDLNVLGIRAANDLAVKSGAGQKLRFEVCDVSKPLPFADEAFDAVFANDVLCHIPGRPVLLREMYRVLKHGTGRMLFSDALVLAGLISQEEIAIRSSIGYYLFGPPGENERLMRETGFTDIRVQDTTEQAAGIAKRWHEARERHKAQLMEAEGRTKFVGLQQFLSGVYTLTQERRLLRHLYTARKP